jgi:gliding motility-associated protein GldL
MKDAYMQAAGSVKGLADATAGMGDFHTQVQGVSKNMAALNALYESELTESNNHLKVMNKFYGTMAEAAGHLESTKEDALKYKDQIASLNKNLGALNSVYGGMLNAMRPAANS